MNDNEKIRQIVNTKRVTDLVTQIVNENSELEESRFFLTNLSIQFLTFICSIFEQNADVALENITSAAKENYINFLRMKNEGKTNKTGAESNEEGLGSNKDEK